MAEDRKFKFEDGHFVNRVSGEEIPDDEPVIIFRARDRHALQVLYHYQQLCSDEHHQLAIEDRIQEFQAFRDTHPLKEPGITRHIVLNSELGDATTAGKSGEDANPIEPHSFGERQEGDRYVCARCEIEVHAPLDNPEDIDVPCIPAQRSQPADARLIQANGGGDAV